MNEPQTQPMTTSDGGSAFPCGYEASTNENTPNDLWPMYKGMSLRDWFAGMAMQSLISTTHTAVASSEGRKHIAICAFEQARVMLAERAKG